MNFKVGKKRLNIDRKSNLLNKENNNNTRGRKNSKELDNNTKNQSKPAPNK